MMNIKNKKVSVSFKTNSQDKDEAAKLFDSLGMNLSTALNVFIKKSIAEGGLPFELKDPFYSKANQDELNRRFQMLNDSKKIHQHNLIEEDNDGR